MLSFVILLGLFILGGIRSCPAAMYSPSPNTFVKKKSLLAAGRWFTKRPGNARPAEPQSKKARHISTERINVRRDTSLPVNQSMTTPLVGVLSSHPSSGLWTADGSSVVFLRWEVLRLVLCAAIPNGLGSSFGIRTISLIVGT